MTALEWNPVWGPIAFSLLALGAGGLLVFLFQRLAQREGPRHAWTLLWPKILLVALLLAALLDPVWKSASGEGSPLNLVVLRDVSSSMDLKDGDAPRGERAAALLHGLESSLPQSVHLRVVPFDESVHGPSDPPPRTSGVRGTDLVAALASVGEQGRFSDADGVLLLTDGGDEPVIPATLPAMPLALVGIGTPSTSWNDIGLGAVTVPDAVEEGAEYDLAAEVFAGQGTPAAPLAGIKVALDAWQEGNPGSWSEVQSKTVNLQSFRAAVSFHLRAGTGTAGDRYRLRLPELPGELTYADNTRTVAVALRKRSLHVLYFTQELGSDYKYLRSELAADPGIAFTAMYRVLDDRFTVQGDRTGAENLDRGLPADDAALRRYDCILLGSFPASLLSDAQASALVRYVEGGGALVLLGGEASFGRGGYDRSKLAPLIPWAISKDEAPLTPGGFPVGVNPAGTAVAFTAGWREALAAAGGAPLDSVNQPGNLRPGALSLLDATVSGRAQPVVALEPYGKGQVLGIATNTLWHWATAGAELKGLYGKFWRQTLRGLTQKTEGGAKLALRWDRDRYRPGESASLEVRFLDATASSASSGTLRLVGTLTGPGEGEKQDIPLTPRVGQAGLYAAQIPLPRRGDYVFHLAAYVGDHVVENDERALSVAPGLEEGASPELKKGFLREIAKRTEGVYLSESEGAEGVAAFVKEKLLSRAREAAPGLPLTDMKHVFLILVLLLLIAEWFLRRRKNLL